MSLCFNVCALGLFTQKKTCRRLSHFALWAAGGFVAAVISAEPVLAQNIELTPDNIGEHTTSHESINWLKTAGDYEIKGHHDFTEAIGVSSHDIRLSLRSGPDGNAYLSQLIQANGSVSIITDVPNVLGSKIHYYTIHGGTTHIDVSKGNGVDNNEFRQYGGATDIIASGSGRYGLSSWDFVMEGGSLTLQGTDGATALYYPGKDFNVKGGTLRLKGDTGSGSGWAVYGGKNSAAFFGGNSVLKPVLDINTSGELTTGRMSFSHVTIEKGARVEFELGKTEQITRKDAIDIPFLESRDSPIEGEFTRSDTASLSSSQSRHSRLFYDYSLIKDENQQSYKVRVHPRVFEDDSHISGDDAMGDTILKPPALLYGSNRAAAIAVEQGLSQAKNAENTSAQTLLNLAYDKLYNSETTDELQQHARGLHAYQTTRLPSLITTSHDRFSYSFQRELTRAAAQSRLKNADKTGDLWAGWIKPLGGNENYRAHNASYRGLGVNYGGLSMGSAGRYRNVTTGAAVGFMQGRLTAAEGYNADIMNLFVTTGLTTDTYTISRSFKPFIDMGLGYGWSRLEQNRRDTLGGNNNSVVKADSVRLTLGLGQEYYLRQGDGLRLVPKATLDYTYIRQNKYREHGGYLPLAVSASPFHSLRPKIGTELLWAFNPQLALNAYGYYRYELLDRRADLNTGFATIPGVQFVTTGESVSRSSANLGFEVTYHVMDNFSVSGSYDLLAGKNYEAHQLYIQSNARF